MTVISDLQLTSILRGHKTQIWRNYVTQTLLEYLLVALPKLLRNLRDYDYKFPSMFHIPNEINPAPKSHNLYELFSIMKTNSALWCLELSNPSAYVRPVKPLSHKHGAFPVQVSPHSFTAHCTSVSRTIAVLGDCLSIRVSPQRPDGCARFQLSKCIHPWRSRSIRCLSSLLFVVIRRRTSVRLQVS